MAHDSTRHCWPVIQELRRAQEGGWKVRSTPFGTVFSFNSNSSRRDTGPQLPFFTGSLFGAALRMILDIFAHGLKVQQNAKRLETVNGIPLFPQRFTAKDATMPTLQSLLSHSTGLAWELEDAESGQYLGRLEQHDSSGSILRYHNPDDLVICEARRVWTQANPLYQGRGQVISLIQTRTNKTLANVVELAPFSYQSSLTRWLNSFYTSFTVFNDWNEQEILIHRYSIPKLFSYFSGLDANGRRVVQFKLPLAPLRWKTNWRFHLQHKEASRTRQSHLHALIFPTMAAFHSIDTAQSSLFRKIFG